MKETAGSGSPPRRWRLFLLPLAIVLLGVPYHSYLSRAHPSPFGFGGEDVIGRAMKMQVALGAVAVLIGFALVRRARSSSPKVENPAALPLILGLMVALPLAGCLFVLDGLSLAIAGNERVAAEHHRLLMDAELRYAVFNGGLHDQPGCLLNPARCLPSSKGVFAPFLADEFAHRDCYADPVPDCHMGGGYTYRWVAGAAADPAEIKRRGASASSVVTAAWLAMPTTAGQTGLLAFCADSTGRVCSVRVGEGAPEIQAPGGLCPRDCESLP